MTLSRPRLHAWSLQCRLVASSDTDRCLFCFSCTLQLRAVVTLLEPKSYSDKYNKAVAAGPQSVDLHAWSPYYYQSGLNYARVARKPEISELLMKVRVSLSRVFTLAVAVSFARGCPYCCEQDRGTPLVVSLHTSGRNSRKCVLYGSLLHTENGNAQNMAHTLKFRSERLLVLTAFPIVNSLLPLSSSTNDFCLLPCKWLRARRSASGTSG